MPWVVVYFFFDLYLPPGNEVWGKVMFLHVSVILFTGGEYLGRYPPGRYTRYTPRQVHPPGGYTRPQDRYTPGQVPPAGTPPGNACWDMVNKGAVRILLECILVKQNVSFCFLAVVMGPTSIKDFK